MLIWISIQEKKLILTQESRARKLVTEKEKE